MHVVQAQGSQVDSPLRQQRGRVGENLCSSSSIEKDGIKLRRIDKS